MSEIHMLPSIHNDETEADAISAVIDGLIENGRGVTVAYEIYNNEFWNRTLENLDRYSPEQIRDIVGSFYFCGSAFRMFSVLARQKSMHDIRVYPMDADIGKIAAMNEEKRAIMASASNAGAENHTDARIELFRWHATRDRIRNEAMLENIERISRDEGGSSLVIFTGASHATYLKEHLEQDGHDVMLIRRIPEIALMFNQVESVAVSEHPDVEKMVSLVRDCKRFMRAYTEKEPDAYSAGSGPDTCDLKIRRRNEDTAPGEDKQRIAARHDPVFGTIRRGRCVSISAR